MKRLLFFISIIALAATADAQDISTKDFTKPQTTEVWEPRPKVVTPGIGTAAPSDAIILFDGKDMNKWVMAADGSAARWKLQNGVMTIDTATGDMQTSQKFGDCQLHIEFRIPADVKSSTRDNSGNSGVFMQERYEVQIFDSYQNEVPLYANGQIGSIYKQVIPLANASSKPGEWNTFDIYYTAPVFRYNGSAEKPAFITLVHNGILTLNHFEIQGTIQYIGIPRYEVHGKASVRLQSHHSPVSFRNIWIREL